jgi:hypothetical protein
LVSPVDTVAVEWVLVDLAKKRLRYQINFEVYLPEEDKVETNLMVWINLGNRF